MNADYYLNPSTNLPEHLYQIYVEPSLGLRLKRFSSNGTEIQSVILDADGSVGSIVVDNATFPSLYVSYRRPGTAPINTEFVLKKLSVTDITAEVWSTTYQFGDPLDGFFPRLYLTGSPGRTPNVVYTDQNKRVANLLFSAGTGVMTRRTELRGLVGSTITDFTNEHPQELVARAFGLNVYIAFPNTIDATGVTILKLNGRTGSRIWNKDFDLDNPLSVKSGIRVLEDTSNHLIYLVARSGTEKRISAANLTNGDRVWVSPDLSSESGSSYGADIHGFEMFLDVPTMQTVLTDGSVKVFKISPADGSPSFPRTTSTGITDVGSNVSVILPLPGDKLYIPHTKLSDSTGSVYYQEAASVQQVDYPDSDVRQNQLVSNTELTKSYLTYRKSSTSEVRLVEMGYDNTLVGDYLIDSGGGQLPNVYLSGTKIVLSCFDFYTNFTEFVRLKIFHVLANNPSVVVWSRTLDIGESSTSNIHPVLAMTGSTLGVFVTRFDGRVSCFAFKVADGSISRVTAGIFRISSKLSYGISSGTLYLSGVKFGDSKRVVGGAVAISSHLVSNPFETDLHQPLIDKISSYVAGFPTGIFAGAYGTDGEFYIESLSLGTPNTSSWATNSGITDELADTISGFSAFEDNLLVFIRSAITGHLKTYKYGLDGRMSFTTLSPGDYFPPGSPTLPPTGSSMGSTLVYSIFPYERYVVVSKTSDGSGPVRISEPNVSILHGNYTYTATFTNSSNILTVDATVQHGLSVDNFVRVDFGSSAMLDGFYRVIEVPSATTFVIDYDRAGVANGSLSFSRLIYTPPSVTDLTDFQTAFRDGFRIVTYNDLDDNGLVLKKISETVTSTLRFKNIDSFGQLPTILLSGDYIYISFIVQRQTLTDILYLHVKKLEFNTLTQIWSVGSRYFPDADRTLFRTRLVEIEDRLNVYHFRENGILYGNPIVTAFGGLNDIQKTTYQLSPTLSVNDVGLTALPGLNLVEFIHPSGADIVLTVFNPSTLAEEYRRIYDGGDPLGLKSRIRSRPGSSSTVRYLFFQSGTNSGVIRYDPHTGDVMWERQSPSPHPILNLYEYLRGVFLFSVSPAGDLVGVILEADSGSNVTGLPKTTPLGGYPHATVTESPVLYAEPDWGNMFVFFKNSLSGGFPIPSGEFVESNVYSSAVEAVVTNTVSELTEYQSVPQPVMFLEGATYTQTGNIVTVQYPNHGILLNARVGLRFITGGGAGGTYDVVISDPDSFKVMVDESLTTSGIVSVSIFDNFFTCYYTDAENGLEMVKFVSNGGQYQVSIDPLGQFPSLFHDVTQPNHIYVSYVKNVTSFVDYLKIVLKRVNTLDLSDDWVSGVIYTDTPPDTFRPRMTVTGQTLHVGYCQQDNKVYVSGVDKFTGTLLTTLSTGIALNDASLLQIRGTSETDLYIGYTDASNVVLHKFSSLSPEWSASFDGGDVGVKQNLSIRESLDGVIVSYNSGTGIFLTRLDGAGTIVWKTDVSESGAYGERHHGFYTLSGSPFVFFVVPRTADSNLADLVCKKYDINGALTSSRTSFLETFDGELVVGPPLVFSRSYVDPFVKAGNVFNSIWMVYPDPTGPLYPNWVILVNRLEVPPTPISNFSLVQTTDNQYTRDEPSGIIYTTYVSNPGKNEVFLNRMRPDGITDIIRSVDVGGYGSVISVTEDFVYIAYSKNVLTYTDYLTIEIRKYFKVDLSFVWGVTRVFTDSLYEFFFPRLRAQGPNLFMAFTNQTGVLSVERYSAATGALIDAMNTGYILLSSELGELSTWASETHFYLSLPEPSSSFLRLQKYGVDAGSIQRLYSTTFDGGVVGQKSGIVLRTPGRDIYPHDENLIVGFTNSSTEHLVSKFPPVPAGGNPEWTTSLGVMPGIFTQRILGMGIYGDYSQIFLMRDNGGSISMESRRLSPEGTVVESNSTSTPLNTGDISTSVDGGSPVTIQVSPVILSNPDWSTLYIECYVREAIPFGEQVSPYDRLVVTALQASLTYSVSIPVSELSTNQFVKPPQDIITHTFVVYSHETEGVKISKVDNSGTVLETRVVDPHGQSPSLTVLGPSVYVSYIFQQFGFLSSIYHRVVRYDLNLDNRTFVSEYNYPELNTASFRPRITSFGDTVVVHYVRQTRQIIMETISTELSLIALPGEFYGGADYLHLSTSLDEKIYLIYPINYTGTNFRFLRIETDGTVLWANTVAHTSPIIPLTRLAESGSINVYYDEGSGYRFRNYDEDSGSERWNSLQTIPDLVFGEIGNVYADLGYTLIFGFVTSPSNTLTVTKLNEDGAFVNSFDTDLTGVISSSDIDGRIVILSDNPWDTLYYAHYTNNPGLGSIPVSPTRFVEVSAHTIPPTRPLPIPPSELSEYQVAETADHVFIVQSDQTNGLVVLRVEKSSNSVTHTFTLPVSDYAFAPSISILNDILLLTHVEYVTTFIEFVFVRVTSLNLADLSLNTTDIKSFPDPLPDTFRPRTCVTDNYLHIGLVRFDREVYVLPFDPVARNFGNPLRTNLSTGGSGPYVDPLSLAIVSTSNTVTLVLPDLVKDILLSRYLEKYDNLQNTYFDTPEVWTTIFDGGVSSPKSRPRLGIGSTGLIYIAYDDLLTKLTSGGAISWSESLTGTLDGIGGSSIHGFHLFEQYPLIQTILTSDRVAFGKFNDLGEEWSTRTTPLTGTTSSDISGTPVVVSYFPYTRTHIIYQSTNVSLYNLPGRNLVFRVSDVTPSFIKPVPPNKNVEGYQGTALLDGTASAVNYTPDSGSKMYYFDGSTIVLDRVLSTTGIFPSISRFQNETLTHVEYIESVVSFTEYQVLNLSEINSTTLTDLWSHQQILPYHVSPTTIIRTYFDYIAVLVLRDNRYITLQIRDRNTGNLLSTYISDVTVSRVEDITLTGQDDVYISFPEAGGIRVICYEVNGNVRVRWSVILETDSNIKYHVRLTQNLTGRVFLSYIGKLPADADGFLKLLSISPTTGAVEWTKTLFDDMAVTDRINGLDNEGSFVNVTRLGLQLLDTDNSTFDLVTKNNSYTGTISRTFEDILSGFPDYVDNPLVIYNQGDGWVILVYEDGAGTFQMVRTTVVGGAVRVDYDADGKVISPVGYPYYWRPRITINPNVHPSNHREFNLVDGKFTGLYREWWNNGHLKTSMLYDTEGRPSGRHVDFERTGQYRFEVTSYTGTGEFREWKPPTGTNLPALFSQYDVNSDGYLDFAELFTLIEEYGGFEISPEDRVVIFEDFDKDGDAKISLQEFVSRFGSNVYTRRIPFTDLQHSVLVMLATLVDGRKTGSVTHFHPFRPEGGLRVISTADSLGRLTGPYAEYYYDGTTQKLVVAYNQGKKTGTQTERYPPEQGGGISRVTVYPPGAQSNDVVEYYPGGSYKSIFEPFVDPFNPYTAFRYTEYFDKTSPPPNLDIDTNIRRRYFLDNFRLKNGTELYYSSPGVLETGWPKTFERGKEL